MPLLLVQVKKKEISEMTVEETEDFLLINSQKLNFDHDPSPYNEGPRGKLWRTLVCIPSLQY